MQIAIIGTGALASLFAARLAPLASVVMVGSWQEQIDAINQRGLQLIELDGSVTEVEVEATNDLLSVEPSDVALILTKSYQTAEAVERAEDVIAPHGAVITLQNGLGNLEQLQKVFGDQRATIGVTAQGATVERPGVVRHAGNGPTYLTQSMRQIKYTGAIISYLRAAGLELHVVRDADALVWRKLAINAAINPLTAILDRPNGYLLSDERLREIMLLASAEVAAVAAAQGIELPEIGATVIGVAEATATNRSSMLQDVSRGAPTEIDAICGAVIRAGQRLGVPTPINNALLESVLQLEEGAGHRPDLLATLLSIASHLV